MGRFVLIDGTIRTLHGHHYSYAARCKRAAEGMGHECAIATNRDWDGQDERGVFPVYRNTILDNGDWSRFNYLVDWLANSGHRAVKSALIRMFQKRCLDVVLDGSKVSEFSSDTADLFAQVPLGGGDTVFLPTSDLTQLLGALDYASAGADRATRWVFLFRHNLFHGPPHQRSPAHVRLRLMRLAFRRFLSGFPARSSFYTDTDQLTEQYNMVVPGLFKTLPIPHTSPKRGAPPARGEVVVSYMGDARGEKGYHLMPGIVRGVGDRAGGGGGVRFVIQSNYNIPEGEPGARMARSELRRMPPGRVTLVTDPLPSGDYQDMLFDSDAVLLPYDPDVYFARSSGICAEALAGGIPVIAPAGSWMARQFLRSVYAYQDSFGEVLRECAMGEAAKAGGTALHRGRMIVREGGRRGELAADVPPASHLRIRAEFGNRGTARLLRMSVRQESGGGGSLGASSHLLERLDDPPHATCLVPLARGTGRVRVVLEGALEGAAAEIDDLRIHALKADPSAPVSAVGAVYHPEGSIAGCVKDLADNISHYRETARAFSDSYYAYHNADSMMRVLVGGRAA